MPNPVIGFEIGVRNARLMQDFYSRLFGWQFTANDANSAEVETGGPGGIGGTFVRTDDGESYVTFTVKVTNLTDCLKAAEKMGATVITRPTKLPDGGGFAVFEDPEGNYISLYKET